MGNLFARFQSPRPGSNLHSSGIVGDDTKIGITSSESFAERQQINKNRQFVGAYQDAGVLHNYRKDAPRTPRADTPVPARSKPPVVQRPQAGFTEPTSRRYNPYS